MASRVLRKRALLTIHSAQYSSLGIMAHTLSPEDYRTLGVSFYKSKQYDKAIEAFTHGINASIVPAATLLDYRAAVYEKLENFELAAKDGYNMIRAHKKDVKGYLRVGSTFQKQNKLDRALRIYNYGLQNVPITHEDFKVHWYRVIYLYYADMCTAIAKKAGSTYAHVIPTKCAGSAC